MPDSRNQIDFDATARRVSWTLVAKTCSRQQSNMLCKTHIHKVKCQPEDISRCQVSYRSSSFLPRLRAVPPGPERVTAFGSAAAPPGSPRPGRLCVTGTCAAYDVAPWLPLVAPWLPPVPCDLRAHALPETHTLHAPPGHTLPAPVVVAELSIPPPQDASAPAPVSAERLHRRAWCAPGATSD